MKYFIFLILSFLFNVQVIAQEWNYTADILEKKNENNREVRIFKSNSIGNKQVVIYNDTLFIYTNQAKQYVDTQELHLIGPVTMINGKDSLNCDNMIFWYELDNNKVLSLLNKISVHCNEEINISIYSKSGAFE